MHALTPSTFLTKQQVTQYQQNGFLLIKNLIEPQSIDCFRTIFEGVIQATKYSSLRSDLSGNSERVGEESIVQVMRPSRHAADLINSDVYLKCAQLSRELYGLDMALDFDMLIDKPPRSNTVTPWHQDCAYWPALPDTRALSIWIALDNTCIKNGCMWYVPGSHLLPTRPHKQLNGHGPLQCQVDITEAQAMEVDAGDAVIHHGNTLHYSGGNSIDTRRRALITNYRPEQMIKLEREQGYDHTGVRAVKNTLAQQRG